MPIYVVNIGQRVRDSLATVDAPGAYMRLGSVRIEVVNPTTGGPLEIVDANGKPVRLEVFVETSYFAGGL